MNPDISHAYGAPDMPAFCFDISMKVYRRLPPLLLDMDGFSTGVFTVASFVASSSLGTPFLAFHSYRWDFSPVGACRTKTLAGDNEPMSVELNMWHQVGIAHRSIFVAAWKIFRSWLQMNRFLRTTRVGTNRLHSLAYVSWTSSVRPDHDHFPRGTTLQSEQVACGLQRVYGSQSFFNFPLAFTKARNVALDEIHGVLPSLLVYMWHSPGFLCGFGFFPSYLSLEKALAFCEGRVPLDALIGLGLLFLGLLFLSHDSDSENWVCEFRGAFTFTLFAGRYPRLLSGVCLFPLPAVFWTAELAEPYREVDTTIGSGGDCRVGMLVHGVEPSPFVQWLIGVVVEVTSVDTVTLCNVSLCTVCCRMLLTELVLIAERVILLIDDSVLAAFDCCGLGVDCFGKEVLPYSALTATTPIESNKPLFKDEDGVDVHVHMSMIGSLMYLTTSRPDIMFAVCTCLWYPRDSPFELEAYSDSDYRGASLDRKSTTGGCQFLGRRLISWQCKKQTILANSTTKAEYVTAANCCGKVLWIHNQMMDYGFNFINTKIHIDNESTISVIKNPVAHSRTKHIEIRFHFIRDCYEKRLIEVIKIHTDSNVADLLTKGFDVTRFNFFSLGSRESLERDMDGTEEFLLSNLFDFWLTKVSTDRLKVSTDRQSLYRYKAVRDNTGRGLNSIYYALTVSPIVSTSFVEQFWTTAKSRTFNNTSYIDATVVGKPVTILEASIRSDLLFNDADGIDSLNNQAIFDNIQLMGKDQPQTQTDPSPRPSPSIVVPDFIPEGSGGNHGGQSSNDASLSGNEDGLTLQSVYDLCVSLCKQVTAQAKEIKALKAQVKKLKKGVKPLITHHKAWMKTILARKTSLKKNGVHKEYVSKQGRKSVKSFKGEPSVHKDLAFDDLDDIVDDAMDYMEFEDAQDEGRTSFVVVEEKEIADKEVSTKAPISTDKQDEGTDKKNEGTDKQDGSTDCTKVSTDRQGEGTADQNKGKNVTQTAPTPTSTPTPTTPTPTVFGDDETIAQVLIIMSQNKEKLKEKEKGVEIRNIEDTERPRPTSTRSILTLRPLPKIDPKDKGKKRIKEEDESDTESEEITEAEKKFKQLANDEEVARKVQEEWEAEEEKKRLAEEEATKVALTNEYDFIQARINADKILAEELQKEEREKFTIEQRAKFLHDTIAAQRKFLAQQRSAEDERQTKELNKDPKKKRLKKRVVNETLREEDTAKVPTEQEVTEQGTKKRKSGHVKMIIRKRPRPQPDDDSDDEHRKCLRSVTFEGTIDIEIMETKSFITRLHKVSSPDGNYLVVYRVNGHFMAFNYLMEVLYIFDRHDLFHLYDLVMKQYSEITPEDIELIL
ncbi:hypothetical protein Tco_1234786 [Tanacetum coccineum]